LYYPLFSPAGVLILSVLAFGLTRFVVKQIKKKGGSKASFKIKLINMGLVLVVLFIFMTLLSNFSKPSQVDISPLEQITTKPFYEMDELKAKFAELESINGVFDFRLGFSTVDLNADGLTGSCSYTMRNSNIPADVDVYFSTYNSTENTKELFNWERKHSDGRKRAFKLSDDIDVLLCNSRTERVADQLYEYNGSRYVTTIIRIGNMVIHFLEAESVYTEIGALTSKNIKLICDVLQE